MRLGIYSTSIQKHSYSMASLSVAVLIPTSASAQQLGGGGTEIDWLRVIGSLFLCLILAVLVGLLYRWKSGLTGSVNAASPRQMRVLEITRLSARVSLYLVEVAQHRVVISVEPTGSRLILDLGSDKSNQREPGS